MEALGDIVSMPSLASSSEGTSPGTSENQSDSIAPKSSFDQKQQTPESKSGSASSLVAAAAGAADAGLNKLLMAAHAMTSFGGKEKTGEKQQQGPSSPSSLSSSPSKQQQQPPRAGETPKRVAEGGGKTGAVKVGRTAKYSSPAAVTTKGTPIKNITTNDSIGIESSTPMSSNG